MDFKFTEEHKAFREMAAQFARNKLAPMADSWDEHSHFPVEVLREAAQLGMAGWSRARRYRRCTIIPP